MSLSFLLCPACFSFMADFASSSSFLFLFKDEDPCGGISPPYPSLRPFVHAVVVSTVDASVVSDVLSAVGGGLVVTAAFLLGLLLSLLLFLFLLQSF